MIGGSSQSGIINLTSQMFSYLQPCVKCFAGSRQGWTFVLRSICKLQDACEDWSSDPFAHKQISPDSSPESQRIWDNKDLRQHREFVCEDGKTRYMSWHIKQRGQNLRIHYDPDAAHRIVRIGHIGGRRSAAA